MVPKSKRISSGINYLDEILGGGVYIGDNVVWYDDVGSLAHLFCYNFIKASLKEKKSLIYLSFDRSIKNLMEQLGSMVNSSSLTILDCFTYGKGEGAKVFLKFYEDGELSNGCQVIRVDEPRNVDHVTGAFYGLHKTMKGDVRFVFDSLTGMQELWGGEEHIRKFYSHSCPRLYELNTIAYWIVEKEAHSQRLRAHINKIAQVAIDLSAKRGKTTLTILKAEKREQDTLNKAYTYWAKGHDVTFESEGRIKGGVGIGKRLKELRTKRGFSQTELAKLVGVTPSTISQVESDLIHPSLPALFKIAEVLSVEMNSFFKDSGNIKEKIVFPNAEAMEVTPQDFPTGNIRARLLTPLDFGPKAEPYLIEIPPGEEVEKHFFVHKGEEFGYLLSGELQLKQEKVVHAVGPGDVVYLTSEIPTKWINPGEHPAVLLWIKIR